MIERFTEIREMNTISRTNNARKVEGKKSKESRPRLIWNLFIIIFSAAASSRTSGRFAASLHRSQPGQNFLRGPLLSLRVYPQIGREKRTCQQDFNKSRFKIAVGAGQRRGAKELEVWKTKEETKEGEQKLTIGRKIVRPPSVTLTNRAGRGYRCRRGDP